MAVDRVGEGGIDDTRSSRGLSKVGRGSWRSVERSWGE